MSNSSLSTVFFTSPFDLILSSYLNFEDYLRLCETSKALFDELHARPWILVHFGERPPFLCVFGKGNASNNFEDGFPVLLDGDQTLLRKECIRLRRKLTDIKKMTKELCIAFHASFLERGEKGVLRTLGIRSKDMNVSVLITYWKRVMFSRTASWFAIVTLAYMINKRLMMDMHSKSEFYPQMCKFDEDVRERAYYDIDDPDDPHELRPLIILYKSYHIYKEVWGSLYDICAKIMLQPFYIEHFAELRTFGMYILRDLVLQQRTHNALLLEQEWKRECIEGTTEFMLNLDALEPKRFDGKAHVALAHMLYHSLGGYHLDGMVSNGPFRENKCWMSNRRDTKKSRHDEYVYYDEQRVPFLPDWMYEKGDNGYNEYLTPVLNMHPPVAHLHRVGHVGHECSRKSTFWDTMGWKYTKHGDSGLKNSVPFAATRLNCLRLRSLASLGLNEFILDAVSVNDDSQLYETWYHTQLQSRLTSNSIASYRLEVSPLLLDGPLTHSLISSFRMVERLLQLEYLSEQASLCSAFKGMHILYYMCSAVLQLIPDTAEAMLSRLKEVKERLDHEIETDYYECMDNHWDRILMRCEDLRKTANDGKQSLHGQSSDVVGKIPPQLYLWLPSFFDHYNTTFHRLVSSLLVSLCYIYRWGLLDGEETLPETDLHGNALPYRTIQECLALTLSRILMCIRVTWKYLATTVAFVVDTDPSNQTLNNKLRTAYMTLTTRHAESGPSAISFLPRNLISITSGIEVPLMKLCNVHGREPFNLMSDTMAVQSFRRELLLFRDEIYRPMLSHFAGAFTRGEEVFSIYLEGGVDDEPHTFDKLEVLIHKIHPSYQNEEGIIESDSDEEEMIELGEAVLGDMVEEIEAEIDAQMALDLSGLS